VAFKLKPKEISDVVKTEFGFHIIQTTERQEARLKPFEEVKDQIQKEMVKQQVMDKIQQIGDQVRAAAAKNPENLEQIAQQFNVNFYKVEKAAPGDPLPSIGNVTDFSDAMFSTAKKKGDVTDLIQAPGNKLVVGVLDEIIPSRQAELSEVESQIRNSIQSERAQRMLSERSAAIMEKTRAAGGDLRKAAADMKLTVATTNEFGPDGNAEGIGGAQPLGEAFRRDVGTVFGPINVAGVNYICKVVGKVPADMSKLESQRYDLLLKLKSKKAQGERRDVFQDGLIQYLKAKGVVKIHDNMIKRLVDSFKST
jgi:peptidyl-prolyl cis-trans isomerase D